MRTLVLLALVAQAATPESPPPLSLKDAVAIAQQRNPAVAAARHRVEAARAHSRAAKALPNPDLSAVAVGSFNDSPLIFSQTFDVLGKLAARTRSATAEVRVAEAQLQATTLAVTAVVETAYVELLAAIKSRDLVAEGVRLAQTLHDKAVGQFDAGDVARSHVVRARLEVGRLQQGRIATEAQVAVRSAALNSLLAREPAAALALTDELAILPVTVDETALTQSALVRRPELLAARAEVKAREAQVGMARAQRLPDFVAQARAGERRGSSGNLVGLGLSVPLFDWGSTRGAVNEAKAVVAEQVALSQQLENLVKLEVESALRLVKSAHTQVENYQRQVVPDADELIRMMLASYPQSATILEVIDAQRTAVAVRLESYEALANYRKALAELRRAVGGELPVALDTDKKLTVSTRRRNSR